MKRNEEIKKAANELYDVHKANLSITEEIIRNCEFDAFVNGAQWADTHQNTDNTNLDFESEVKEWIKSKDWLKYKDLPWYNIEDVIKTTAEHFYNLGIK